MTRTQQVGLVILLAAFVVYVLLRVRAVVSSNMRSAVVARSSSAMEPRTCSCVMTGLLPMMGRRKVARDQASVAAFLGAAGLRIAAAAALALERPEPELVVGPPAGMLVRVVDPFAAGRAGALGFEPNRPLNQPSDLPLVA